VNANSENSDPFISRTPWVAGLLAFLAAVNIAVSVIRHRFEWLPLAGVLILLALVYLARWRRWKRQRESGTEVAPPLDTEG
jgi:membrane protein DedA with SNARE-associated domain